MEAVTPTDIYLAVQDVSTVVRDDGYKRLVIEGNLYTNVFKLVIYLNGAPAYAYPVLSRISVTNKYNNL